MLIIAGFALGALIGVVRAARRGSDEIAGLLHWAAIHGILFALIGLIGSILIDGM